MVLLMRFLSGFLGGFVALLLCVALSGAGFGGGGGFSSPTRLTAAQSAALDCLAVTGNRLYLSGSCTSFGADSITDEAGTGAVTLTEGATTPTGKKLVTPEVEGLAGENFFMTMPDGQEYIVREGAAQGGHTRIQVRSGDLFLRDPNQGSQMRLNEFGLDRDTSGNPLTLRNGADVATGKTISTESITYRAVDLSASTPADGTVLVWVPTDASSATDNVVQVTDQAGTDEDFTHGAIDVEAP